MCYRDRGVASADASTGEPLYASYFSAGLHMVVLGVHTCDDD